MMEYSSGMTYGFYGLMSILSATFVWKWVPGTKGKTLEQMEHLWKGKQDSEESIIIVIGAVHCGQPYTIFSICMCKF